MNPRTDEMGKRDVLPYWGKRLWALVLWTLAFMVLTGADPNRVKTIAVEAPQQTPVVYTRPSATFRGITPAPTPSPEPTPEPTATPVPTPTPTPNPFPHYAPGELQYEDEFMRISIEQQNWEGITYFTCEIEIVDPAQLKTAFSLDAWNRAEEAVSAIANRHQAILAINGDYYSFHRNGIIIREGQLYRENTSTRHLLVVEKDGDLSVITNRNEDPKALSERLMTEEVLQTFEFGPVLVQDGEAVPLPNQFFIHTGDHDEPRTAIGQLGPLHYLIIVVDGRRDGYSRGATLRELQTLFLNHGAQTAFNLDGGGSTTLYFNGEVINLPAAGSERGVSDILMFKTLTWEEQGAG